MFIGYHLQLKSCRVELHGDPLLHILNFQTHFQLILAAQTILDLHQLQFKILFQIHFQTDIDQFLVAIARLKLFRHNQHKPGLHFFHYNFVHKHAPIDILLP